MHVVNSSRNNRVDICAYVHTICNAPDTCRPDRQQQPPMENGITDWARKQHAKVSKLIIQHHREIYIERERE